MPHPLPRTVRMLIAAILIALLLIMLIFGAVALIPFVVGLALGTRL